MPTLTKGPFRKVKKKGYANFWRGRVTSYSNAVLECGHVVTANPSKGEHPGKVRCSGCAVVA